MKKEMFFDAFYRDEKKGLQILLSYSQAGPGRKAKQGQEEISRNHVQRLFLGSVYCDTYLAKCATLDSLKQRSNMSSV